MNKCVKIRFSLGYPEDALKTFVQKHARKLELEGIAQVVSSEDKTLIFVCGPKDDVDVFVDLLHKGTKEIVFENIEVEPFLKVKDYRGVFRVIE